MPLVATLGIVSVALFDTITLLNARAPSQSYLPVPVVGFSSIVPPPMTVSEAASFTPSESLTVRVAEGSFQSRVSTVMSPVAKG